LFVVSVLRIARQREEMMLRSIILMRPRIMSLQSLRRRSIVTADAFEERDVDASGSPQTEIAGNPFDTSAAITGACESDNELTVTAKMWTRREMPGREGARVFP
jgi:hypothetical protein